VCFDFLYNFCLKHFSFQEELIEILSQMYTGLHVNHPLFLSDFNTIRIFSTDFQKNTQLWNFIKIRPIEAQLFHADGRTDMKLIVAFHNIPNAPKTAFSSKTNILQMFSPLHVNNTYVRHHQRMPAYPVLVGNRQCNLRLQLSPTHDTKMSATCTHRPTELYQTCGRPRRGQASTIILERLTTNAKWQNCFKV
jgi:hypothetical protein